jgi:hypothetical protein
MGDNNGLRFLHVDDGKAQEEATRRHEARRQRMADAAEYKRAVRRLLEQQTEAHVDGNIRRVNEIRENIRIIHLKHTKAIK